MRFFKIQHYLMFPKSKLIGFVFPIIPGQDSIKIKIKITMLKIAAPLMILLI